MLSTTFGRPDPTPGTPGSGLFRNLTLTQIYTDNYLYSYLHQGLTQMWSLAVEAAFYVVLPLLAYLLLVVLCRRRWRPMLLLTGLSGLALITPGVAGPGAHHRLSARRRTAVAADVSAVVHRRHDAGRAAADGSARATRSYACRWRRACFFIVSTPIAGAPTTSPAELREALFKAAFYAAIAALMVAPLALGDRRLYAKLLASRPMVWLGEISYEIFLIHLVTMELAMVEILHFPIYTGSIGVLFVATFVVTVPVAWLLHRFTRVRAD